MADAANTDAAADTNAEVITTPATTPNADPRRMEIIRRGTGGRTKPVRRTASAEEVRSWMIAACVAADAKTDATTLVFDVGEVLSITTWFVVTSGRNGRQVKSIVDNIEHEIDAMGGPKPLRMEGLESLDWVVADYGDFVVHAFHDETRAFYELERLYKDVPVVDWQAEVPAAEAEDPDASGSDE